MRRFLSLLRLFPARRLSVAFPRAIMASLRRKRVNVRRRGRIELSDWPKDRLRDVGLLDGRSSRKGRASWE